MSRRGMSQCDPYPEARIILAADNDIKPEGPNVGHQKAQEAAKAVSGTVVLPELDGRACDWWDVRHEKGNGALVAVFNPPPRYKLLTRDDLRQLPDLKWRIDGVASAVLSPYHIQKKRRDVADSSDQPEEL